MLLGVGDDFNPAGRLPITYYANMSEAGDIDDYSMHHRTYRYSKATLTLTPYP